jgi:ATP synthase protein I
MSDPHSPRSAGDSSPPDRFQQRIQRREEQKLRAKSQPDRTLRVGLSAFGVVGWSVAVPTLIGVLLGMWIDRKWPSEFSWTLALLLAGVTLGCLSAWTWVSQEQKQLDDRKDQPK